MTWAAHFGGWLCTLCGAAAIAAAIVGGQATPAHGQPQDRRISRVIELTAQRDFDGALALMKRRVSTPMAPKERLLLARLLELTGDYERAAKAYGFDTRGFPSDLAEWVRARRILSVARTSSCGSVRPDLLAWTGAHADVAQALAAKCLFRLGRYGEAARELRSVVERDGRNVDTHAVQFALVRALFKGGDRAGAEEEARALLVQRPYHPDATVAQQWIEKKLGKLVFTEEQRIERARSLAKSKQYAEALADLEAMGRPAQAEVAALWLSVKGHALFKTRKNYPEAARVLAASARAGGPTVDAFMAAKALSRSGKTRAAIKAYEAFAKSNRQHARATEATYLAALLELGRSGSDRKMKRVVAGLRKRSSLRKRGLWGLAFHAFGKKRYAEAIRGFEAYAKFDSDAMVRGRGLYWAARAYVLKGDKRQAKSLYREVIEIEQLHWYALLARQRLMELGETPPAPFADESATPVDVRSSHSPHQKEAGAQSAETLFAMGLRDDALELLVRSAARKQLTAKNAVAAFQRLGADSQAYRQISISHRSTLQQKPNADNAWAWNALYPQPYAPQVHSAVTDTQVEPEYVWAIMRQESAYDREAVSYADAIGLIQLMPATAERVGKGLGIEVKRQMLFDPHWNVLIGTTYCDGLLKRFGGQKPLSTAGYNAGGHRVKKWLAGRRKVELDRFVEEIPYDQTRNYVRRVTTHYARYRYLARLDGEWPVELPRFVGVR